MKTQGEFESEISDGMVCFEQEYMGRGPKEVRAHLIGDMVVVRLRGVLTAAEQHLVKTLPSEKGRDLLKQVRNHLLEIARPAIVAMIEGITGGNVVSLHHDISTSTGEEVVMFTLAVPLLFREPKRNSITDLRRAIAPNRMANFDRQPAYVARTFRALSGACSQK